MIFDSTFNDSGVSKPKLNIGDSIELCETSVSSPTQISQLGIQLMQRPIGKKEALLKPKDRPTQSAYRDTDTLQYESGHTAWRYLFRNNMNQLSSMLKLSTLENR